MATFSNNWFRFYQIHFFNFYQRHWYSRDTFLLQQSIHTSCKLQIRQIYLISSLQIDETQNREISVRKKQLKSLWCNNHLEIKMFTDLLWNLYLDFVVITSVARLKYEMKIQWNSVITNSLGLAKSVRYNRGSL